MKQRKKKPHFEKNETGYHKHAVRQLAKWVKGKIEVPFEVDGKILFVPDVVCYNGNVINCIYEIVYSHPLTGKKLGLIQYWCYRNCTELTVFEVSADYILKQTKKPYRIETMECYIISPFQNEEYEIKKLKIA
jgi:hypothetical protein